MWIIALVGSLAVLVIFFLWIPLDIILDIDVHGKPKFGIKYRWLFGLVKGEPRGRAKKPPEKEKPSSRRRRLADINLIYRVLTIKGLAKNFLRLVKSVLGSFRLRGMAADLRLGLDDPADTGMLFAVLGPATALLGPSIFERISIQPSFEEGVLVEGYTHGAARLRPIRLVPPVLKFTFSRPTVRALWTLVASRFKRKK